MAKKINTHMAASDIAEMFDNMLIEHNMSIKTEHPNEPIDEDEQAWREEEDDTKGLWSMPFANLQDRVEEYLIELLEAKQANTEIASYEYSSEGNAIIN